MNNANAAIKIEIELLLMHSAWVLAQNDPIGQSMHHFVAY